MKMKYCIKSYPPLLVFLLLLCASMIGLSQNNESLKVMTFNIWYDNPEIPNNVWAQRKSMICELLKEKQPDLIGMQEVLLHQLNDLAGCLTDYEYIGRGREDGGSAGEFVPVFYRRDLFRKKKESHFWLSENPDIPGSKSWDACCTRMVSCIKLIRKSDGREFMFCNTHFDQRSELARDKSAAMLMDGLRNMTLPVVLSGDFNFRKNDRAYQIIAENSFSEAGQIPQFSRREPSYTFVGCDFQGKEGDIIDFVFVNEQFEFLDYQIIEKKWEGLYPSDHLPVMVEIK